MQTKLLYRNAFMSLVALMCVSSSKSQVATQYTFSQSSGVFSAITGGTVFGSTASDDQIFVDPAFPLGTNAGASGVGIPIGFDFKFNNFTFDRFALFNDGVISFGQSVLGNFAVNSNSSNYYSGISSTSGAIAALQNRVVAFSRDLQGQTGSELRVQTIGSSPNQVLVIQWSNYRKYNAGGDNYNFQIRLYETTNVVEIIFGTFINVPTPGIAELGLRGSTNSDYNNRITDALNIWSASIAGNANTALVAVSAALVPSLGQLYKWTPPQCSGSLSSLTTTGNFAFVCLGGFSTLSLLNTYTASGVSYQWQYSTSSAAGPFTVIPNTNNPSYAATTITSSIWFQAVSTCFTNSSTVTSSAFNVQVAGTTTNSVPYQEGFEGLIVNNQLPNCSWAASNMPAICQTNTVVNTNNRIPFTGNKFASFKSNTSVTGDYFYTNGIQMNAGVTYSASVAYVTDGNLGWSNFSILYGASQSSAALTTIASVGPASGTFYQQLSNTFTVPVSGIYYIAIKCIANATPQYLSFDDVRVTIPCSLNAPNLSVSASSPTVCSGSPVTITAAGANTYSWSTGDNTSVITVTPGVSTNYVVVGTNTASGCTATLSQAISVIPSPNISLFVQSPSLCLGASAQLYAFGSTNYTWSNGSNGTSIIVSPTTTTLYNVLGSGFNGCVGSASLQLLVNPLPNVTAISSAANGMCLGETTTLTANGANTYQWAANSLFVQTAQVLVSPTVVTTYTLTGTDLNTCSKTVTLTQLVLTCVGMNESDLNAIATKVYPNPTEGIFNIDLGSDSPRFIKITDLMGRTIFSANSLGKIITIDSEFLSKGIYYITITTVLNSHTLKLIKN